MRGGGDAALGSGMRWSPHTSIILYIASTCSSGPRESTVGASHRQPRPIREAALLRAVTGVYETPTGHFERNLRPSQERPPSSSKQRRLLRLLHFAILTRPLFA